MSKRYIKTDDDGNIVAVANFKSKARKNRLILLAIAVIGILIAAASCVGSKAEPTEPECVIYTRTIREYEVQFGDSVSRIAARFCPEFIDFAEYQKEFMRLNNCDSNIYAGEVMRVYVYEE